jgi:hypothetical protein
MVKRIAGALLIASGAFLAACSGSGRAEPSPSLHKTLTQAGAEVISGSNAAPVGNVPVVPVHATGAFTASGTVAVQRCSPQSHYRCMNASAIDFANGSLDINQQKGVNTQQINATTCQAFYINVVAYTIAGGGGAYVGAAGRGTAQIEFTAVFPKINGACNIAGNASPLKGTVRLNFVARGPVTLK